MGRRKTGKMIDGWLIIDKPVGAGSTEMVSKARWALRARKAGHAGTLDPLASGVLAVAFGEATKTVPYVMEGDKHYRFTVRWGAATDTDDLEGEVIREGDTRPDAEAIRAALPDFSGEIAQVPPLYSAIKVNGVRAYDLARAGELPELAPRPIHVRRLALIETRGADEAVFDMVCGKGGYVRAIARDLGEALGCHGHVIELRRTISGPFSLEDAVDPASLDAVRAGEAEAALLSTAQGLAQLPEIAVDAAQAAQLRNGNPVQVPPSGLRYGDECWASFGEEAVAVGMFKAGAFHPKRVLLPAPSDGGHTA